VIRLLDNKNNIQVTIKIKTLVIYYDQYSVNKLYTQEKAKYYFYLVMYWIRNYDKTKSVFILRKMLTNGVLFNIINSKFFL
jgi:hypothetical protein